MGRDQNLLAIDDPLRREYQVQVGRARTQPCEQPQPRHFARGHLYKRSHKLDNGAVLGGMVKLKSTLNAGGRFLSRNW
jgi:hypothetical protein